MTSCCPPTWLLAIATINIDVWKHLFTLLCITVSPWTSPFVVQAHDDCVRAWWACALDIQVSLRNGISGNALWDRKYQLIFMISALCVAMHYLRILFGVCSSLEHVALIYNILKNPILSLVIQNMKWIHFVLMASYPALPSCSAYYLLGYRQSGLYFMDPDGVEEGVDPFLTECDLSVQGKLSSLSWIPDW